MRRGDDPNETPRQRMIRRLVFNWLESSQSDSYILSHIEITPDELEELKEKYRATMI